MSENARNGATTAAPAAVLAELRTLNRTIEIDVSTSSIGRRAITSSRRTTFSGSSSADPRNVPSATGSRLSC